MSFNGKPVKGVLLDITGVLQEDGKAIPGSVEAVEKLKNAGIDVRFVTNETQLTRKKLLEKLHGMKFSMPEEAMYVIVSPLKVILSILSPCHTYDQLLIYQGFLPIYRNSKSRNFADFIEKYLGNIHK